MQKLYVYYKKTLVGLLQYEPLLKNFNFVYDDNWIKEGFELSPSLKFSGFEDYAFKLFVENLLPEGEGLDEMSIYYQISKSDKFSILKHIGAETTGALTFTQSRELDIPTSFREIPLDELEERVSQKNVQSIILWDEELRLSLAGVQEKLAVAIIDGVIGLGEGDICSTHILKFNRKNENVILNEYLSLKLAKAVGINVAQVEYKKLGSENVLFVERFDRKLINDKHIERLHIIDSTQALGYPSTYKYERLYNSKDIRDGVSFEKLFNLAEEAKIPLLFKKELVTWNMINLILGNSDAHGKNISFFVDKNGLEIAPFYDIVNVSMYKGKYAQDMAMAIDDEFEFEKIGLFDMLEFLQLNKISKIQYFNDFKKLARKIYKNLDFSFIDNSLKEEEKGFIQEYKNNIIQRLDKLSDVVNRMRFDLPFEDESYDDFFDSYEDTVLKRVGKSDYSKQEAVEKYLLSIENELIPS
ncbi:HipA domain-containing protein [Sulfurimonas sp.]|uniref:HipA domain-containing protein n=1 Tax=Sulfurimonas sp. TaxID=2022749 RepID=UPI002AB320C6|nr:HipA domain-containing protein [Sulfurimonas sp.]